jgi:hypothetical protein
MPGFWFTGDDRKREKSSTLRDYGVPNRRSSVLYQGFAARSRARLEVLPERILATSNLSVALNDRRTTLADVGGLFERVAQLQYAPIVVVTANDLNTNRKAAGRKCAGN